MTSKKKLLLCSIVAFLSTFFTGLAHATSIVNLDDVPHNVTLSIAGSESIISLMPYQKWESQKYPIKIVRDSFTTPALEPRGKYAIWNGGKIALQNSGRRVNGRY